MDKLREIFEKFKETYREWPTSQKIFYAGALAVLIGSLAFAIYSVNKTEYSPLYTRLSEEDMGGVVGALKAQKIPYSLSGNTVSVPTDKVYETRLALATEGIPKGGSGVGFEIFDQQKLGSTEFVQKINYQRALQGELARTINRLDEVLESRVHLVIPPEALFAEDQKAPTASVVLKIRPNARLEKQQIQGIVNLVSSAVQGLKEENVSVLSTDGNILFKKSALDDSFQMSNLQMKAKEDLEEKLRQKVQTLMEQVVGPGRAMTRVALDMDFNQAVINEETYDPDSAVIRSQQRSVENTQGGELGTKGNPDVPINVESQLMQTQQQQGQQQKQSNRQRETVNYEINRVTRQITHSPGSVKKLSVAVVVDGSYEMKPNKDGKEIPTFVGRAPEQMRALEDLARKAVGFDEGRGDQVTVSNIAFASDTDLDMSGRNKWLKMLEDNQKMLLNILLIVLAFIFIVRPFMRKFERWGEKPEPPPELLTAEASPPALPAVQEEEEEEEDLDDKAQLEIEQSARKKAAFMVQHDPEQAAVLIRALLREEE